MQMRIAKWGNSQGIRLSKKLLAGIGIDDPLKQQVKVSIDNNKLIIEKAPKISKLADRFKDFDLREYRNANNESKEFEWGSNAGKELI
jgi:antitoxin MazE